MTITSFQQDMLPTFSGIDPAEIKPKISEILKSNRLKLAELLNQPEPYTWENLMQPLEDMSDELNKFWSPISHLHAVMESETLRTAYNETLPIITEYHTELTQHEKLFHAISSIANSADFKKLEPAQQKIIENDIRDFKLAGIHLPSDKKKQAADLQQQLSQLMTQFSENILDATHAWTLHITDKKRGGR